MLILDGRNSSIGRSIWWAFRNHPGGRGRIRKKGMISIAGSFDSK
jgi:hypothetical protein